MVQFALLSLASLLLASACATPASPQYPTDSDSPVTIKEGWSYIDCGTPGFSVQLDSIVVSPDPPQPGQNLTVTAKGTVSETIKEGAYADVTVKLGLIKLLHKQFDVCEEARNANVSITCPVEPGTYTIDQTVALPKEIPRAKFGVEIRAYTVDEEELLCLNLKVDFMKKPFFHL
ncbi:hypothetical protein M378DRAFT_155688 [Amanita muscaria Koide BX008]|uniref:Phosphatidylglycerol/phosphatidylinositol transfer protein n=1 Tax=Amanita muscaria (strain Koide BX008) TaxID=946122 RepID=A0A0C2XMF6_AMAMK|nr:hypothetical protein M378DRAFT_155688 [Amanita muscaria Koide BX008]